MDCKSWTPVAIPNHPFVLPRYSSVGPLRFQVWQFSKIKDVHKVRLTRETDEDAEHRKESFKKIFDQNIWGKENPSGGGSSLTGKVSFNSS